jgi:hypothetical protein
VSTRFADAESEMFAILHDWASNSAFVTLGYALPMRWPGKEELAPDETRHWARVSTQTVISRKVGFVAEGIGGRDQNKFEVAGLLFVQLFAPKTPGAYEDSKVIADDLVSILRKYRSEGTLAFKNVRPAPLNPEPKFYRINVVSETEYEQLD